MRKYIIPYPQSFYMKNLSKNSACHSSNNVDESDKIRVVTGTVVIYWVTTSFTYDMVHRTY